MIENDFQDFINALDINNISYETTSISDMELAYNLLKEMITRVGE